MVDVYNIKMSTISNIKVLGLLVSDKKIFNVLPFHKKGEGQTKNIIFQTLLGPWLQCCIPSLRTNGPLAQEKRTFKGFLPYMGMAAILVK